MERIRNSGQRFWARSRAVRLIIVAVGLLAIAGAVAFAVWDGGDQNDRQVEIPPARTATPTAPQPATPSPTPRPPTLLPSGFDEIVVVGDLEKPTAFAFAPDGRIFIALKEGTVRIARDGVLLPVPFIELAANSHAQRGLMGLVLDPDFETNGYVYLYYTYENDPAHPTGPKTGQLLRVTAAGDVAVPGNELVLLGSVVGDPAEPSCDDFPLGSDCIPADGCCHVGGGLRFASDGTLFVATGDAADTEEMRFRVQDLSSLAGKMLRINPDGSAPPDNPFFTGDPTANRSKVWAYGLREPFRFGLQPGTDLPFVGDVGSLFRDEIDIVTPGANLGWPCYEGEERFWGAGQFPLCQELFSQGPQAVTAPIHTSVIISHAVIGGDFASAYPEPYTGAYFFGDWAQSSISYLTVDDTNTLIEVQLFATSASAPVALNTGPEGEIYYLAWSAGELRHIRWVGGLEQ